MCEAAIDFLESDKLHDPNRLLYKLNFDCALHRERVMRVSYGGNKFLALIE